MKYKSSGQPALLHLYSRKWYYEFGSGRAEKIGEVSLLPKPTGMFSLLHHQNSQTKLSSPGHSQ